MGAAALRFNGRPGNLRGHVNTSSIMVRNGASIMHREGGIGTTD
jgi:hypothetical protein